MSLSAVRRSFAATKAATEAGQQPQGGGRRRRSGSDIGARESAGVVGPAFESCHHLCSGEPGKIARELERAQEAQVVEHREGEQLL